MTGVIYARYSSAGQNEQTIEGQIRICREYAKNNNINIIKVYTEKKRTGTNDERPEFQRLIKDCDRGGFDVIIVYMLDRFARNIYDSIVYEGRLAKKGIKVVSATERISDDEGGEFYRLFLEWNNEKYSTRLSKRVKEGLTTSVLNRTFTGSYLIYGYKKDGLRVLIDEQAAETVKYIFAEYAKGVSKQEIAAALNDKGLRKNGKPWKAKDFDRMLINEKYTGSFTFGGRPCVGMYPAIIDRATFDEAQKRAQTNKHHSGAGSARVDYLLSGKAFCGHCGASMVADGGTSKTGVQHHYYACPTRKKRRGCDKSNERKDALELYVTKCVVDYLSDPRRVAVIADDVIKYYESRTDVSELTRVAGERARTQKEIDNAVNLLVSGVSAAVVKTLDKKITELSALLDDLNQYYDKLKFEKGLRVTRKDIIKFVAELIDGDINDKEFQKRLIDRLINSVYIYDRRIVVFFNIKVGDDGEIVTKDDIDDAFESSNINALAPPSAIMFEHPIYIFVKGFPGIVVNKKNR